MYARLHFLQGLFCNAYIGCYAMPVSAVFCFVGVEPTWAEARRQLNEQSFIKQLVNFDKDNISDRTLKKIGQYCAQPDFQPDIIGEPW